MVFAAAIVAAAGGLLGDMLVPAHFVIGPHRADLRVTLGRSEVIDLGPLGSLSKPSPYAPLGFRVTVRAVPAGAGEGQESLSLEQYARLYSDYDGIRSDAVDAIAEHTLWSTLAALLLVAVLTLGGRALLGRARRAELLIAMRRRRRRVLAGTLAVALAGVAIAVVPVTSGAGTSAPPMLDGTPLEGATVHGALLQLLVNDYGPRVVAFVQRTHDFSEKLSTAVDGAYRGSETLVPSDRVETFLFMAGLHCNLAMAQPLGRVVSLWKPGFVLSGGDDTLGATGFESSCIDSLARRLGHTPVLVTPGDHDSAEAERQMREHGYTVLDGSPIEMDRLRILGDDDPRIARFGEGISPRRTETVVGMGERLARTACGDRVGVDIVVANEPGAIPRRLRRAVPRWYWPAPTRRASLASTRVTADRSCSISAAAPGAPRRTN